ncbi:unnamed protein product [Paramecium octaurelia]|uniref:Uncharacterized protein n=1 Tax=Paramecium octaurelia TaxID=43137 RepID=A0A8S1S7G6_PAROT|nr:unnamed protein product [Paramecium octaurelia]
MSQQQEIEILFPQNISQSFLSILLQHSLAATLTFQQAVKNLMSEDFALIHYGLISIGKSIQYFSHQQEDIGDQQKEHLITIIQQILQVQMPECLQYCAINVLFVLLNVFDPQHQLLIKKLSFESLCQIYNKDATGLFHNKIIIIFGILSKLDNNTPFQLHKCCNIQQRLEKITSLYDSINYLQALKIFCKEAPQCYKSMTLDFIKTKLKVIKTQQMSVCNTNQISNLSLRTLKQFIHKITISIIKNLMKIESPVIDQQLLTMWDEVIVIWVDDHQNNLECSVIQIVLEYIQKINFPKEKIEDKVFQDRLLLNLDQDSTLKLFETLQIYQYLIKQFSFCIANDEFFKKLMQICQNSQSPIYTTLILKIIIQMIKSQKFIPEYLPKLQQFNIIGLLPEYLDEVVFIIEKLQPCSHLSVFFKQKQQIELKFAKCVMKLVTLILKNNKLIDVFKTEIAQFESVFLSERCQNLIHQIHNQKIQEKLILIIELLQNNKSYQHYEATDNKKIKLN